MPGYDIDLYDSSTYGELSSTRYYLTINGSTLTRVKQFDWERNLTKLSGKFNLLISDPTNTLYNTVSSGDELKAFRTSDNAKIFGGYIETVERTLGKAFELSITGGDYTTYLNQVLVRAQVYNDKEFSIIVRDIINKYILKGTIIDSFDATTGWTSDSSILTTISSETGTDANNHLYARFGTACLKVITASTGIGYIEKTYTNGYQLQPTDRIQIYFYIEDASDVSGLTLRIGQDNSNYYEMSNEATLVNGWNYLIFDMANKTDIGTVSLFNNDYVRLSIDVASTDSGYFYLDEMRINPHNDETDGFTTDKVEFTNNYTTVQFKNVSCHEAIKKIANARPVDYDFYVDINKDLNFGIQGTISSGVTLTRGNNILSDEFYDDDTNLINKVTVYGARQLFTWEEKFSGNGSTDTFTLTYEPVDTYITVGGTEQLGYQTGMTGTTFDYKTDQKNRQIIFESGSVPGVGTNNIVVNYTYSVPITATYKDTESISNYGLRESKIENEYIFSKDDALTIARQTVSRYKDPIPVGTSKIKINPLIDVGETVQYINDKYYSTPQTFVVTSTKSILIGGKLNTTLKLSALPNTVEDYLNNLYERINALEEKEKGQSDVLIEAIEFLDDLELIDNPSAQLVIRTRSITGNQLIWDNDAFGLWDTYNWAGGAGIWGNDLLGVWGVAEWGEDVTTSFLLGNSLGGILGTSKLGTIPSEFSGNLVTNPSD